jgi:hypothetical protein
MRDCLQGFPLALLNFGTYLDLDHILTLSGYVMTCQDMRSLDAIHQYDYGHGDRNSIRLFTIHSFIRLICYPDFNERQMLQKTDRCLRVNPVLW